MEIGALFVRPGDSTRRAVEAIDRGERGIALVVDDERRLVGTVTDGDVRRAMLEDANLERPVSDLLRRKAGTAYAVPVTAPRGTSPGVLVHLMHEHLVRQVPLLDADGRVADLATLDDLVPEDELPVRAVVMAGGFGTRLRPLTEDLPKPMLPVGDRPMMEWVVEGLRESGVRQVAVTTYYKPEKIRKHFGDGAGFGVDISYVQEEVPLGTAGAIGYLPAGHTPLLVVNGDVLTRIDFRALLRYHQEHKAALTMAVRRYEFKVPYGVVRTEGERLVELTEKPSVGFFVNAGIYLLEPDVARRIRPGEKLDMTDLVQRLLAEGARVVSFPLREYWLDIGQMPEYRQALEDVSSGRLGP